MKKFFKKEKFTLIKTWLKLGARIQSTKNPIIKNKAYYALERSLSAVNTFDRKDKQMLEITKSMHDIFLKPKDEMNIKCRYNKLYANTFQDTSDTISNDDYFIMYEEIKEAYAEERRGHFLPLDTIKQYGVDIFDLDYKADYYIFNGAMETDFGLEPKQMLFWTDDGIKKVIAKYPRIRSHIESKFKELTDEVSEIAKRVQAEDKRLIDLGVTEHLK